MDLILSEISRKDKQLTESQVIVSSVQMCWVAIIRKKVQILLSHKSCFFLQPPGKKYFKRKDLAAKQAEDYWQKQKRLKGIGNDEEEVRGRRP